MREGEQGARTEEDRGEAFVRTVVGHDGGLKSVFDLVRCVAPTLTPVSIYGETGVGKDLIARTVHELSPRAHGPFVRVNCPAIAETLFESELFGSEKGAFTSSIRTQVGRFERAQGGTLFLDEVGELSLLMQSKLLNAVQLKVIERVGGEKAIHLDIRIVVATNKNLFAMARAGTFREDLLHRLNVFSLVVPPLWERMQDLPALVAHIIQKKCQEMGIAHVPVLDETSILPLTQVDWPGNIRQLEHLLERSLILHQRKKSSEPLRCFEHMPPPSYTTAPATSFAEGAVLLPAPGFFQSPVSPVATLGFSPGTDEVLTLDEMNRRYIRTVLLRTHGQINGPHGAAVLLGIHPNTLRNRMHKLGIAPSA